MRLICLPVFLAAIALSAPAQETTSPAPPAIPAAPKAFTSAPQSPEMKKLVDTFAGSWRVTIRVEKNDWFPTAGTANGHAEMQAGPAGNSLTEHLRSHGPLGDFAGSGMYWYDPQGKSYKRVWCDSLDPTGCGVAGAGNWEGGNFVFNSEMPMPQGTMRVRETFSNITHESFDFALEASTGDGPLVKMMTIRYERAGSNRMPR